MRLAGSLSALAVALAMASSAQAQQLAAVPPIVGYLRLTPVAMPIDAMREQLARRGLIDGTTIRIDQRVADGKAERLPELAQAMVRDGASVIVAVGTPAARAVQAVSATVPIVAVADIVVEGLVASMARPGGNLTGVSPLVTEIDAKKLEILHELLPGARRVGVLYDANTPAVERRRLVSEAAAKLGFALTTVDVRGADDMEPAFATFRNAGVAAILVTSSSLLANLLRPRIREMATNYGLPLICEWRDMVEAGCLASYGTTLAEMFTIAADYVDRILKGAKPADLPVQQPTRFELVINGRTAKAFGLTLQPSILLRADEVIK